MKVREGHRPAASALLPSQKMTTPKLYTSSRNTPSNVLDAYSIRRRRVKGVCIAADTALTRRLDVDQRLIDLRR